MSSVLYTLSHLLNTYFHVIIGSVSSMTQLPDPESSEQKAYINLPTILIKEEGGTYQQGCKNDVSSPELDLNTTSQPDILVNW